MRNKCLVLSLIVLLSALNSMAQQLPIGTCGIVCTYDAAGNRLKRVYFCNNGIDPYPQAAQKDRSAETTEVQLADELYPNPTTGKFTIEFSKPLQDAFVSIIDNSGRVLSRIKTSGSMVLFDLSPYAAGMYYVRIEEGKRVITKKVVKQ